MMLDFSIRANNFSSLRGASTLGRSGMPDTLELPGRVTHEVKRQRAHLEHRSPRIPRVAARSAARTGDTLRLSRTLHLSQAETAPATVRRNALVRHRAKLMFRRARTVRHSSLRCESDIRLTAARDSHERVAAIVRRLPQRGPLGRWASTNPQSKAYIGGHPQSLIPPLS
jgi:hypothetical protein